MGDPTSNLTPSHFALAFDQMSHVINHGHNAPARSAHPQGRGDSGEYLEIFAGAEIPPRRQHAVVDRYAAMSRLDLWKTWHNEFAARVEQAVIFAFAVLGIVCGLPAGAVMSLPARVLAAETRAVGMGIFFTVYYVGMFVAPGAAQKRGPYI